MKKYYFPRFSAFLAAFLGAVISLLLVTGVAYALIVNGSLTLAANNASGQIIFQSGGLTTRGTVTAAGSWNLQNGAIATNATDGFTYLPSSAGTPTGVPTAIAGGVPLDVDTTNFFLYARLNGSWQIVGPLQAGTGISITSGVISATSTGGSCIGWISCTCQTLISKLSVTNGTATCFSWEFQDTQNNGLGIDFTTQNSGTGAVTVTQGVGVQVSSGGTNAGQGIHRWVTTNSAPIAASTATWAVACLGAVTTVIDLNTEVAFGATGNSFAQGAYAGVRGSSISGSNTVFAFVTEGVAAVQNVTLSTIGIDTAYHTFAIYRVGGATKGFVDAETPVALTDANPTVTWGFSAIAINGGTSTIRSGTYDKCVIVKAGGV